MANGIPLRPGLIPSYAQRLGLLAKPGTTVGDILGVAPRPPASSRMYIPTEPSSLGGPDTSYTAVRPVANLRRPAPLPPMPLAAGAMRQAQRSPMAPSAPAAQPGFLERIAGIDPTSAAGQALGAAAATGLQLSGYRTTPITTAEGLGAMMAAGQKAFREQKAAEREARIQAEDIELKRKLAEAKIQESAAKAGLPFRGTSMDAQDRNVVLGLSDKMKNGTATESERAIYNMSYSRLSQPRVQRSYGPNGEEMITQIPPVDLSGVFSPAGIKPQTQQTQKPTALQQDQRKRIKKLQSFAGTINSYRRELSQAKQGNLYQGAGRFGELAAPSEDMVKLLNRATEVRLGIKDMEELGALVGGDFAILDQLVDSPNSFTALRLGPDSLLKQLDNLEDRLADRIQAAQSLSGIDEAQIRLQ